MASVFIALGELMLFFIIKNKPPELRFISDTIAPSSMAMGIVAIAAGFVNCMGYIGAATGDIITGISLGEGDNWQRTIYIWAIWAFAGAITVGFLWNATAHESHEESANS